MPDPNPDLEKTLKLQAFKDEVKKIKAIDETLRGVVDISKLDYEELELWGEWKTFFVKLEDFFNDFEIINFAQRQNELKNLLSDLRRSIKSLLRSTDPKKDYSQREFVFWLRNRAGGIVVPLEALEEYGLQDDLDLIKQFILEEKPKVSF